MMSTNRKKWRDWSELFKCTDGIIRVTDTEPRQITTADGVFYIEGNPINQLNQNGHGLEPAYLLIPLVSSSSAPIRGVSS